MKLIIIYFTQLLILIIPSNSYAQEYLSEFDQNSNKSKSKYQRITTLEKYLEDVSKNLNKVLSKEIDSLKDKITKIEQEKNKQKNETSTAMEIKKLRGELNRFQAEVTRKHDEDIKELRDLIEKYNQEQKSRTELMTESLLKKMLVLERVISNFGKVPLGPNTKTIK